jgi:hypothetical protein
MEVALGEHRTSKFDADDIVKAEKLDDSLEIKIQDLSARIESLEKRKQ